MKQILKVDKDIILSNMSKTRQECNLEIINRLGDYILSHSDIRFGQALVNLDILNIVYDSLGENPIVSDPYYEESIQTLKRMNGCCSV